RQVRWWEFLSEFDFKIVYRKGSQNGRADALSRRPDHYRKTVAEPFALLQPQEDGSLTIAAATYTVTHDIQWTDQLLTAYEKYPGLTSEPDLQQEGRFWKKHEKIFVPPDATETLVRGIHESPLHGHPGVTKTIQRISKEYWFPRMRRHVKEILRRCDLCARTKAARHRPYGQLQPLPVPEAPWESISMDFITKLPLSEDPATKTKYDSILNIVDRLTKYAIFIPYQESMTATQFAHIFNRHVTSNHNPPKEII